MKEFNKHDVRGSALVIPHCLGCCAVDRHVSITFIATLIWFVPIPLVYENKTNSIAKNPYRQPMRN